MQLNKLITIFTQSLIESVTYKVTERVIIE